MQVVRRCMWYGVAGCERVPPSPLGCYFDAIVIAANNVVAAFILVAFHIMSSCREKMLKLSLRLCCGCDNMT